MSSFATPRPSLPGGGVMLTPYKDPRYGYVGDANTTGNYSFQMPDGSVQQAPYQQPTMLDQLVKYLAIAGVGAGFGAGGLSALAPETAASLGLAGSGAADAGVATGGLGAAVPVTVGALPDIGAGGAVALGSDGIPAIVTGSLAGGGSGLGAAGAAGLGAGLGGALANVGSPSLSFPSSQELTSNLSPANVAGDGSGMGSSPGNLSLGDMLRIGSLGMTGASLLNQPGSGSSGASPYVPMGPSGPQPQYANTPFQLPQLMNFDRPGQGNMFGNANSMGGLGAPPFGLPRMMSF